MNKRAFTLIEMMVVVLIIGILFAMAFPAFNMIRDRAMRTNAHQQAQQAGRAWTIYLQDYRRFPTNADEIDRMDPATCELINADRTYLELNAEEREFGYLDPWGLRKRRSDDPSYTDHYVRVALDASYNGEVTYHGYEGTVTVQRPVIAWAVGPDGTTGTRDDVVTW